jgi:serine/threonine protein kinase
MDSGHQEEFSGRNGRPTVTTLTNSSSLGDVPPDDPGSQASHLLEKYWEDLRQGTRPDLKNWLQTHASGSPEIAGQLTLLDLLDEARRRPQKKGETGEPEDRAAPLTRQEGCPRQLLPDATWLEGGELCILGPLHAGGMGEAYLAWHRTLNSEVVVKVAQDPVLEARFRREIEIQSRLGGHEHIAVVRNAGRHDGRYYLVMEYLEGMDLARLVRQRGPLPVADACEAVRQAALGLQYAHEKLGIVHRDVKPSNLLLTRDGSVKLLDFGLARFGQEGPQGKGPASGDLTAGDETLGTVDYMAREQWLDSRVDIRADIYSLGCTLYHLLTGSPPFAGPEYDTRGRKMLAHAKAPVPPIQRQRPDVPDGLVAVLHRLLAKEPDARFATPAEVAAALQPFIGGCDLPRLFVSTSTTPPLPQSSAAPIPAVPARLLYPLPNRKTTLRRRILIGTLAIVALSLMVVMAERWMFASSDPVRIESLEIKHLRGEKKMLFVGVIGSTSSTIHLRDAVLVYARLSRPSYCYLIAYTPDGQDRLCYPEGDVPLLQKTKKFVYPPGGDMFRLEEGVGLQAFVLVVSRRPLPPYAQWKSDAWKQVQATGVWSYDGQLELLSSVRGVEEFPDLPTPFRDVCRFLKDCPGVEAIRGLAFPVQPPPAANP